MVQLPVQSLNRIPPFVGMFALLLAWQPTIGSAADDTAKPRPNFVVIMADDMGYGDSSVYNGWIKTPQMERMAREGLKSEFLGASQSPERRGWRSYN